MTKTRKLTIAGLTLAAVTLTGCSAADTVNNNITQDAENFRVERRIVFVNGITDAYLMTIEGKCNIEDQTAEGQKQLEVICKVDDDEFRKHMLGLSDNVTYVVEQLTPTETDPYHYEFIFRPETIVPDIEVDTSVGSVG